MPKQKLTQFIRSIEDPISSFLYCANADCQSFRRQNEGKGKEKDYEDMTFFRSCVQNVLCSSEAMQILEDETSLRYIRNRIIQESTSILFSSLSLKSGFMKPRRNCRNS